MTLLHGFRRLTIAATLGIAIGCGGANMATYTPVSEQTKFSADSLYSAARDAADQLKHQPRAADSQSHSLDTREKEVATSSIPRLSYKYSFHIETGGGLLAITAACTKNSATSEHTFHECGDDRPERVVQELATLKARILELAPKVEANTPDWGNFGKPEQPDGGAEPSAKKASAKKPSDKKPSDKTDKADKKPSDKSDKSDKGDEKADKKTSDKSDKGDEKADKKTSDKSDKSDKKAAEKSDKKPSDKKSSDKSEK
jgi:hypothetical protein